VITALDRIKIKVTEVTSAVLNTERLLARAGLVAEDEAAFGLDNLTLELSLSDDGSEGLGGLTFEVADIDAAARTAERRALKPGPPVAFAETGVNGAYREGCHLDVDRAATFGVPISLAAFAKYERGADRSKPTAENAVTGLDHVVIRTTHPNRAAALYGARLGLDMRLDRTEPKWGTRLMFFRCGDLIVEIVHNLADEPSDAPDKLWDLSWRVADAEAAHARLKAHFDLSDIRPGRKPGTRVFTVRNKTLGVPTLFVAPSAERTG
jgi:catechol 2,3-dioxygenase-like lactoylglutathione lyase family enzyme